jgi:hypothetical protein
VRAECCDDASDDDSGGDGDEDEGTFLRLRSALILKMPSPSSSPWSFELSMAFVVPNFDFGDTFRFDFKALHSIRNSSPWSEPG